MTAINRPTSATPTQATTGGTAAPSKLLDRIAARIEAFMNPPAITTGSPRLIDRFQAEHPNLMQAGVNAASGFSGTL